MSYYIYDLETYPNCFLFGGKFVGSDEFHQWEISDRMSEKQNILDWLNYLNNANTEMVGFNNLGFDYPIVHDLLMNPYLFTDLRASHLSTEIIEGQRFGNRNNHIIHLKERLIPQIDLVKINHFDNKAKMTSLKALQFAMRSHSVEDLPFDVRPLTHEEKNELRRYHVHDITETEKFFKKCEHLVDIRREFLQNGTLTGDVLNYSDVKIGAKYLELKIGRNKCYSGSRPKQTFRDRIDFNRIILPKIKFRTEPFQKILDWFMDQHLYIKGEGRPKLETHVGGLDFHFGVGGVHASVDNKVYESNDTHQIIDIDVAGMYVAVAIANGFYPEHLGQDFVNVYRQIKEDRAKYPKGTSMNAILKLAGNGAYGNSNNPFSFLYDPQYTFSVTVNGQLQLMQLAELLTLIPGVELIQGNTDGITAYVPRKVEHLFKLWCDEWESMTGLVLEDVRYKRMWIRDVNNYMAETEDGKVKRKGAYWFPTNDKEYEGWWNKDFSNMASQIAVEKVMMENWPVEAAVRLVTNPFDFMLRYKVTRGAKLYIGDQEQLKTVRYYVSTAGQPMKKISKPKGEIGQYKRKNKITDAFFNKVMAEIGPNVWDERIHNKKKSKYEPTTTSVQAGWLVKQCNNASDFDWSDVDWRYYEQETKKLIIGSK